jgi:hypothetical protein
MSRNEHEEIDYAYILGEQQALERSRQEKVETELAIAIRQSVQSEAARRQNEIEENELASALAVSRELLAQQYRTEEQEFASALVVSQELARRHTEEVLTSQALSESEAMSTSQLREQSQGSWDCQQCTFTNIPYAPVCGACEAKPPAHVLVFSKLPDLRFGVELELLIPNGKRDGLTLESIARDLHQLGPPFVRYCGYSHETTDYWKIVTDASISENQPSRDLTCELVSPVLRGEQGLQSLRNILDHVRRLGIATNKSCGFHVHVDAECGSPLERLPALRRISQCFCSVENGFDLLVPPDRRNINQFCQSNRLAFGERSNRQRWEYMQQINSKADLVHWMNPDRYRKLNMTNLTKPSRPSTIEFRQHGGVQDIQQAEAWVRLVLAFCSQAAIATKPKCLLPEGASPRDELRALFDLLDCPGLEQFYMVERRLFAQDRLRNEWKCRNCHRIFSNSRSLSQHCIAMGHN